MFSKGQKVVELWTGTNGVWIVYEINNEVVKVHKPDNPKQIQIYHFRLLIDYNEFVLEESAKRSS
jgi:hypothetical protein